MPAENWKFETDCFPILSPDILQLCNAMLLVDWLQENDFLQQFEHTKEWHFSHVYMTTSVSAYDIIHIIHRGEGVYSQLKVYLFCFFHRNPMKFSYIRYGGFLCIWA